MRVAVLAGVGGAAATWLVVITWWTIWTPVLLVGVASALVALWLKSTSVYSRLAVAAVGAAIGSGVIPVMKALGKLDIFGLAELAAELEIDNGAAGLITLAFLGFASFCLWQHRLDKESLRSEAPTDKDAYRAVKVGRRKAKVDSGRVRDEKLRLRDAGKWRGNRK